MLSHYDREQAEQYIEQTKQHAATEYVLRYSVTLGKWVTVSPREASQYERNHPGHLLTANRVPFHLEGDALAADDQTLIVKYEQIMKPGETPAASGSNRVIRVSASSLGVLIKGMPAEMIVHNGPNGLEVYQRSLVLSRAAGPVARVTYKSSRAGSPLVVVEGD